ncbi:MAG: hypothetical protein GX146_08085 [Myxococcales bacterium]|nr:hypothetical protein [Myxococcales bacterium]
MTATPLGFFQRVIFRRAFRASREQESQAEEQLSLMLVDHFWHWMMKSHEMKSHKADFSTLREGLFEDRPHRPEAHNGPSGSCG